VGTPAGTQAEPEAELMSQNAIKAVVANSDQHDYEEQNQTMAHSVARHYRILRMQGVPEPVAERLASEYQASLFRLGGGCT
jgi:hypothetical protein